ncbi:MAG: SCP2 sterol-binding domain-containing protein [Myxococcales bacterium]|nr:SCP2 sterol-binding domain-containing protein [Myxococcota bacterium]MDW8280404.1 SCP2 sterol-binding domain-containing protein [Myxococcales bacterium]
MATPTSATQLFDENLPSIIEKNPDKAREIGAIYAFRITGEGGGEWTVDLSATGPKIEKGCQAGAQCTIEVANSDFVAMLGNPALGMQLFMQGKLRVTGDPMLAMKLQKLFSLAS